MFGGNFEESHSTDVILHNIDAVIFEIILEYTYSGCTPTIKDGNIYGLLQTSEILQINKIRDECIKFIRQNMSSINVFQIFNLACVMNIVSLQIKLSQYILWHLVKLVQDDTFLEVPHDDLNFILKQYRDSDAPFMNENFLLDGLIRWTLCHYLERKPYFEDLIKMVDFGKITAEYIQFVVATYKFQFRSV